MMASKLAILLAIRLSGTATADDALVAEYTFDDGLGATSGNAALAGAAADGVTTTSGRDGSGAYELNGGSGQMITFPAALTADILGAKPRTVCVWARVDAWNWAGIFLYGVVENDNYVALRVKDGAGKFIVSIDWTEVEIAEAGDGGWHHYCLTYDGATWALYFDAVQKATGTTSLDTGNGGTAYPEGCPASAPCETNGLVLGYLFRSL